MHDWLLLVSVHIKGVSRTFALPLTSSNTQSPIQGLSIVGELLGVSVVLGEEHHKTFLWLNKDCCSQHPLLGTELRKKDMGFPSLISFIP